MVFIFNAKNVMNSEIFKFKISGLKHFKNVISFSLDLGYRMNTFYFGNFQIFRGKKKKNEKMISF